MKFRGKATRACTQTIWIWRWTDGVWVQLDSRTVGSTELEVNVVPGGANADYVSGATGDGNVHVRIRCATGYGTFVSSADLLQITYEK